MQQVKEPAATNLQPQPFMYPPLSSSACAGDAEAQGAGRGRQGAPSGRAAGQGGAGAGARDVQEAYWAGRAATRRGLVRVPAAGARGRRPRVLVRSMCGGERLVVLATGWVGEWMHAQMHGWMDGWMDGRTDGRTDRRIQGRHR
eukprot:360821-Chlamydomonas_euryale.AAC.4